MVFRSDKPTTIKSTKFTAWNCSLSTENSRCDDVRNGKFHWTDTYTITFHGTFLTFFFQSKTFEKYNINSVNRPRSSVFKTNIIVSETRPFRKIAAGTLCSDKHLEEISSETECKAATEALGFQYSSSWDGTNDFPACLYAHDGRNSAYFNKSPNPNRTNLDPSYAAICKGKFEST